MGTIMESNLTPTIGFSPVNVGLNKSSASSFIEANTEKIRFEELRDEHIIPVFSATNEPHISHHEFIETVGTEVQNWFANEDVLLPSIRVSHPIKGRIPEARYKRASELEPWESTLYFERMMFCIEIPSIFESVNGNHLSLVIGGVKAFSKDNLYGKRPSGEQHFQLFIGFQNKVCTNLCISTKSGNYYWKYHRTIPREIFEFRRNNYEIDRFYINNKKYLNINAAKSYFSNLEECYSVYEEILMDLHDECILENIQIDGWYKVKTCLLKRKLPEELNKKWEDIVTSAWIYENHGFCYKISSYHELLNMFVSTINESSIWLHARLLTRLRNRDT